MGNDPLSGFASFWRCKWGKWKIHNAINCLTLTSIAVMYLKTLLAYWYGSCIYSTARYGLFYLALQCPIRSPCTTWGIPWTYLELEPWQNENLHQGETNTFRETNLEDKKMPLSIGKPSLNRWISRATRLTGCTCGCHTHVSAPWSNRFQLSPIPIPDDLVAWRQAHTPMLRVVSHMDWITY